MDDWENLISSLLPEISALHTSSTSAAPETPDELAKKAELLKKIGSLTEELKTFGVESAPGTKSPSASVWSARYDEPKSVYPRSEKMSGPDSGWGSYTYKFGTFDHTSSPTLDVVAQSLIEIDAINRLVEELNAQASFLRELNHTLIENHVQCPSCSNFGFHDDDCPVLKAVHIYENGRHLVVTTSTGGGPSWHIEEDDSIPR